MDAGFLEFVQPQDVGSYKNNGLQARLGLSASLVRVLGKSQRVPKRPPPPFSSALVLSWWTRGKDTRLLCLGLVCFFLTLPN